MDAKTDAKTDAMRDAKTDAMRNAILRALDDGPTKGLRWYKGTLLVSSKLNVRGLSQYQRGRALKALSHGRTKLEGVNYYKIDLGGLGGAKST